MKATKPRGWLRERGRITDLAMAYDERGVTMRITIRGKRWETDLEFERRITLSYVYATERPRLFTEDGQEMFLKIRDNVQQLLKIAGAVQCGKAISCATGDSWQMLACVDRLIELGEIREITGPDVAGQHRVFVKAR